MRKINTATVAVLAMSMACLSNAIAASLDALQGAWMISSQDCAATFEKKNGSIRFRDAASSLATGIIISGDKITGVNGDCTVRRVRQDEGHLSLSMGCADSVLATSMSVSLRIVDADTIEISDFVFPDEMQSYQRCHL
ncbi:MAG TPA: hypothetical protein VNS34_11625 [Rhizobiaceae bacterium]|nr:hypothetical protein [Rhizobiaceae bacterium]